MKLPDLAVRGEVQELIRRALEEDLGPGDCTSEALIGEKDVARAVMLAKGSCVLSGLSIAERVFTLQDASLETRRSAEDGDLVEAGHRVLELQGRARSILAAERVALNFLQQMSGIATLTRRFVDKAAPYGVEVLDTRKTTPTLRILEKYAVRCGGGANHRMGLYDRILIKDNHRRLWTRGGTASLADAVRAARRRYPHLLLEIEVENEQELEEVLNAAPDWVLLDNMDVAQLRRCVARCAGRCKLEASGRITLETIDAIVQTGIHAVSIGALTHSAPAADFSLEIEPG